MNENEKNVSLTEEELNQVIETAKENTPEEVLKMRDSIDNADAIAEEEFAPEIKNIALSDETFEQLISGNGAELPETDATIFDVANGIELKDEDIEKSAANAIDGLNLSDTDTIKFMKLLTAYRKKEVTNVFVEMPQSMKDMITNLAIAQGIPFTEYNKMAKMFMDELVASAEMDTMFVDIEHSLDEALKMPSIADMYSEHTREIMDVKIPEIIEKIKDTEPDNAKTLEEIRTRFHHAYSIDWVKAHFEENTRTRKLMRRDCGDPIKFCDELNFKNQNSKFKMPDCRSMGPALCKVFLNIEGTEADDRIDQMIITETDLNKFVVLICRSCMNMDPNSLFDAAYMYYLVKNITMLNLTNENKTSFAGELINNICDIIEFIREKEAEFNASGVSVQRKNRKRK